MGIIENAKEIADIIKKYDDIELNRKIVELEGEIIELTRTNRLLEEEIEELKQLVSLTKQMNWKKPFYYIEGDETPFCPNCWEAGKNTIHLTNTGTIRNPWYCPKCKTHFQSK